MYHRSGPIKIFAILIHFHCPFLTELTKQCKDNTFNNFEKKITKDIFMFYFKIYVYYNVHLKRFTST